MRFRAVAVFLFACAAVLLSARPAEASVTVSITYFERELSPYGRWIVTAGYGPVWHPTVVAETWAPYVDGEWIYTDCGWTWVSYDPFGQDPFHYGAWVWIDGYGWCWVPGYVWGPAWVTWAYTEIYVGWAPLPPTFALATSGYSGPAVTVAESRYVFVPVDRFVGTNVAQVRVATAQNPTILAHAHRVTRYSVSGGLVRATDPPPTLIERATGKSIRRTTLAAHKLAPAPLPAARVSGKKLAITAPRKEREHAIRTATTGLRTAPEKISPKHQSSKVHRADYSTTRHEEVRRSSGVQKHVQEKRVQKHNGPPAHAGAPPEHSRSQTSARLHPRPEANQPPPEAHSRPAPQIQGQPPRHQPPPPPPQQGHGHPEKKEKHG